MRIEKGCLVSIMSLMLLASVCWAGVTIKYIPQTCESQTTYHNAPYQVWIGTKNHITGDHRLQYYWPNICKYTTTAAFSLAACSTDQTIKAVFIGTSELGTINNSLTNVHKQFQASQIAQAHNPSGGTSISGVQAGNAVSDCSKLLSCSLTISVPPFSVTSGHELEQGVFTYSDSCPARVYWIKKCTTTSTTGYRGGGSTETTTCTGNPYPGGSSPLMMDLSGLGPFTGDANTSGTDIYQLTGRIKFKLVKTGATWKDTPLQTISWPRKGSHMGVLTLPDEKGRVRNGDQVFGNVTECGDETCLEGFKALWYKCDSPQAGGNNDGLCDDHDPAFQKLRWLVGDPSGEHTLYIPADFGMVSINVRDYKDLGDSLADVNGTFRYQGVVDFGWKALPDGGKETQNRPIYDVLLAGAPIGKKKK